MSGGLYRYYHGNWWETKVALYLKKNSLILCESDLGAGHSLGQCCLRSRERCKSGSKCADYIHSSQEIPRSDRDVLRWLL